MQEQIEHTWLKESDFNASNPLTVRIVQYSAVGKDRVMVFELPTGMTRQMSIWGENKNVLIKAFGNESDAWIGRTVRILQFTAQDGRLNRKLEA